MSSEHQLEKFADELTQLCKKYEVELWSDPSQDSVCIELKGKARKGVFTRQDGREKEFEYRYELYFDEEKNKYFYVEYEPNYVQIERKK